MEEGIYSVLFNIENGSFTVENKTPNILNPSFLALSPDKDFLYAVHSKEGSSTGKVSAFKIDPKDGSLLYLNTVDSEGRGPCYISIVPSGQWILVANYSSGNVVVLPVLSNGQLGPATDNKQHIGSSINLERQKEPHAHYIRMGIENLVFAADLGTDEVMLYHLDQKRGVLSSFSQASIKLDPGSGPRHLTFHPDEKHLYILNELLGTVTEVEYQANERRFLKKQTISSLPKDFKGNNNSADIHVHPTGKFLYASNRGDLNSVTVFKVKEKTGKLKLIEIEKEGIIWPRNFAIDPYGKYLLVANKDDDSIICFTIDEQDGSLSPTGQRIPLPMPMCIQF